MAEMTLGDRVQIIRSEVMCVRGGSVTSRASGDMLMGSRASGGRTLRYKMPRGFRRGSKYQGQSVEVGLVISGRLFHLGRRII